MEKILVPLSDRTYPILIGADILSTLGDHLLACGFPKKIAIVTNQKIEDLFYTQLAGPLQKSGFSITPIILPDGEKYKNLQTLETIYDALIENNFDRGSGILALGGGVIGDITGFAAATFLRGVPFAQIPTTLLAQVDSSVGGKTAVNHPLGKNLIGAFYQPRLVLIDVATLSSLDPREVSAGLAEVVKYGVIKDYGFFCWLEQNAAKLKDLDRDCLITAVKRSCQIKADIVEVDENEGSVRAFLNYGHTFGHAIETLSGYGEWKHGEAVAIGMVIAARVSASRGMCSTQDVDRLTRLLLTLDLPVEPPAFSLDDYVAAMQRDKKVKQGTLTMVLNQGIGNVVLEKISDVKSLFSSILPS